MRHSLSRIAPVAALFLAVTTPAHAQACLGVGTPAAASRLLSTTGSGTDLGRALTARYGHVGERLFGGVHLGAVGDQFARLEAPVVGGDVGAMLPLGESGAAQICPTLQVTFQHGAQGSPSMQSQLSTALGVSLGRAFSLAGPMKFIPFVQGGVQHVRQRFGDTDLDIGQTGQAIRDAWRNTHTVFGEMAAGFGLQLHERVMLTPRYSRTLGRANRAGMYQQNYSLGVTFGMPRR